MNHRYQVSIKLHTMETKPPTFSIFYTLIFFSFIKIFFMNVAMAQKSPIPIRVGVVLDMEEYVGEMGMNCISMAISDFYARHGAYYKTRLSLISKDSNGSVVGAAIAALDLLKNSEVQAIIGPLSSNQANFIINLGDEAQVPVITFSATSPSLSSIRSQYFIRATLNDSSQVHAISAIVEAFGWREVVPIYVDNDFGQGIIPFLTDALENVNARVPYRSVIPPLATDDQIVVELYKLMTMQTRVFIVHMLRPLGSRLFTKAKELGMMREGYAWIITNAMTNVLNLMDPSVIKSMLGVIGIRSNFPETKALNDFEIRYKKRLLLKNPPAFHPDLNIFGLWAYDSTILLAMAVERASQENARFNKANISRNSTDLQVIGVSNGGPKLIKALSSIIFNGLAGNFRLVNGQFRAPSYQIVNVVGPGAQAVGYWMNDNGIIKELSFKNTNTSTYSTSKSNLGSIIWPGDTTTPPKGWMIPTNGKKLRIGVPLKDGFTEFLRVSWNLDNSTKVEGYCIDVFDAVMAALPYGNYDVLVGDVTIRANRSKYADFTLPYTESGVSMVVPITENYKRKNALVLFEPLTNELWLTIFCSFVIIGFLIWILEHRINTDFRGSRWHQVGNIFWFAFSTLVFAHSKLTVILHIYSLLFRLCNI
ncbi:hypothetical protein BUALT_Bualt15G0118900 [Buddleja alternifolia]|uniref:Uncharacterized protein n=1 Tax=Buddleja alternifolia TaxID=168488 RepID=A0AAV6WL99_9LAMI|nr:hypothetical protein BUALT_Bualt15G0118900 [Buddleja alternifolia]